MMKVKSSIQTEKSGSENYSMMKISRQKRAGSSPAIGTNFKVV